MILFDFGCVGEIVVVVYCCFDCLYFFLFVLIYDVLFVFEVIGLFDGCCVGFVVVFGY